MTLPFVSIAPGRLLFVFRRRGQPRLGKQAVDLGLQVGDRLVMRFERALLIDLILDQLANGHFRRDLFLLPQTQEIVGWYGCYRAYFSFGALG